MIVGLTIAITLISRCQAAQVGDDCSTDEGLCDTLDNSKCVSGTCQCDEGYVGAMDGNSCLKEHTSIGESCTEPSQCKVAQSECSGTEGSEVCTCMYGYLVSKDELRCLEIYDGLGGGCESSSQCNATDSECKDDECTCKENFINKDDSVCLEKRSKLDEDCVDAIQCEVPKEAVCSRKKCSCPDELSGTPSKDQCVKKTKLGGKCEETDDCLEYGVCDVFEGETEKKCMCGLDYHPDGAKCRKAEYSKASNVAVQISLLTATFLLTLKIVF